MFWAGRFGWRTVWALILAVPALLAGSYIALPASDQSQIVGAIQAAGQALGATGLRVGIEAAFVVCALATFALFFAPTYRKARYLHPPMSPVPPITVYVDAENLKDPQIMGALIDHLRGEFLVGERAKMRADLLFFMDAQDTRSTYRPVYTGIKIKQIPVPAPHYEALYKNGFRLVNTPHIFTGKSEMAEAADREIALHAFERALTSDLKQEFVIVSGDGDYVPLIYRLIALGHSVQIWMWGGTRAYSDAAKYMPITIYNLETRAYVDPQTNADADLTTGAAGGESAASESMASESAASMPTAAGAQLSAEQPHPPQPQKKKKKLASRARKTPVNAPQEHVPPLPAQPSAAVFRLHTVPDEVFPLAGMGQLYTAIYHTVGLNTWVAPRYAESERLQIMHAYLDGADGVDAALRHELEVIGYSGVGAGVSWLRALVALEALRQADGGFPARGATAAPMAARRLYAMALAAAQAAIRVVAEQVDVVSMGAVCAQLIAPDLASGEAQALLTLFQDGSGTAAVDTHYLVWCARALGLLTFVEVSESPMLIRSPQLTPLAEQIIHTELAVPVTASQEVTGTADISPTE